VGLSESAGIIPCPQVDLERWCKRKTGAKVEEKKGSVDVVEPSFDGSGHKSVHPPYARH
jgi:hypothetical protein